VKKGNRIIAGLLLFSIVAIVFFCREIFYFRYEPEYFENWYYHSQWNIPGSTRGISDGELYKFVGFKLVEGENPFYMNYEVPPLGKYLYGLAEKFIGNSYLVSLAFYLGLVAVFFFLAKMVFADLNLALLTTFLLAVSPMIATQVRETMLDLPLTFFYLAQAYFFVRFLVKRQPVVLAVSGVFLGLATGTKFGIYSPFILLFGLILVFLTGRKLSEAIYYGCSFVAGYVLSYFCYFIRHPNPIPWLRLHEKPFEFYRDSTAHFKIDYFAQWRGIFLDPFKDWWQQGKVPRFGDWSPVLPVGVVSAVFVFFKSLKKKSWDWIYISGICFIFLLVNTFIFFWSRYLMPIVPPLVLVSGYALRKVKPVFPLLLILTLPILGMTIIPKGAEGDIEATSRFISTRAYRELYRSLTADDKNKIPESEFIALNETFYDKIGTRSIDVKFDQINVDGESASAFGKESYLTKYGILTNGIDFKYRKIKNQWRLVWNWDYLYPGFKPGSEITVNEGTIPFLKMVDSEGQVVAERGEGKMIYVIPRVMLDWNWHLRELSGLTDLTTAEIDETIKRSIPDHYPRFVGYMDPRLVPEKIEAVSSIPGVTLVNIDYVVLPKNNPNYGAVKDLKTKRPELFYVEADAYVRKDGAEVRLPFSQIKEKDVIVTQ